MSDQALPPICPECQELDRRDFFLAAGGAAAALAAVGTVPAVARAVEEKKVTRPTKPAEDLIRELYSNLSDEQKKAVVLPWNAGAEQGGRALRLGMYNSPIKGVTIGKNYTKPQQELLERILVAISADDKGYQQLTRNGTFDGSHSFDNCGALIFGNPTGSEKFAWVFSGHHLTVRCDGNSEEGAAFGGPMYYGHSPNGYSDRNCFNYQTKSVLSVFDALSEEQRTKAVVKGSPGEHEPSVRFKPKNAGKPGIPFADLSKDQKGLVETVMRTILSPYRKEDADEVMEIVKANGGLEKIHLAFFQDGMMKDNMRWHFWRLEGPGFVWNYRVLPHVHTYVNISSKI